ncbi:MAG: poly-gamma-glutamate synthase PgsB [Candidatus Saccharimonas sp.]
MILAVVILSLLILYSAYSIHSTYRYHRQLTQIPHRIHVNGISGKSSVTRLIAAALRESSIPTIAKTTGTAARIIIDHQTDLPIARKEADIAEQRKTLSRYIGNKPVPYTGKPYQAIVFECMAINPIYQRYLETKVMRSTIGVITNVREDHMDLLGKTLPEIAQNLSATIPTNGHLVTAETDPELLAIFRSVCATRNTQLHAVGTMYVGRNHMKQFGHFEYTQNVAIAIKVAALVGVDRSTAIKGMQQAQPDPGAFRLQTIPMPARTLHWANLFAVNDRESFVETARTLHTFVGKRTKKAVILNNRHDRPERVAQFVNICLNDIAADYIITFGDYEKRVAKEIAKHSSVKTKVIYMGNSTKFKDATGDELFNEIRKRVRAKQCILYGTVNIHTNQARALLEKIESL